MPASAETERLPGPGFGLYVHWPFCESKCPYCDFNSHVSEDVDHGQWQRALIAELQRSVEELSADGLPTLTSIFFGGGTPSLAEPETIAAVVAEAKRLFPLGSDLEVTMEANPSSVEASRFAAYRNGGVNRVSLGIQSLDDRALTFLGRRHDRRSALAAIEIAQETFERSSFDLICARPEQTPDMWHDELEEALQFAATHLSIYQLTIESGTPFARNGVPAADEDTGTAIFDLTQSMLTDAGLPAYEISNHAAPGSACRHNLTYWRGGGYLGIGPGAHGRLRLGDQWVAEHRIHGPSRWLTAIEEQGNGRAKRKQLSAAERAQEIIMTALRLSDGLDAADLKVACDLSLGDCVDNAGLNHLISGDLIEKTATGLRATDEGRLRLNAVIGMLITGSATS